MKQRTEAAISGFFAKRPSLKYLQDNIVTTVEILYNMHKSGKKILVCGNGGSASDSEHIAGEMLKSFILKRHLDSATKSKISQAFPDDANILNANISNGIKCIPLTSFPSYQTAYINDSKDSHCGFAQLVNVFGDKGDVFWGISTSGNSKNIIYAMQMAKIKEMNVIALTGNNGGICSQYADILLNVPANITHVIQEYHIQIYHIICMALESEIYDE